jgi:NDP-sugar pyrophosphorylase family protein
MSLKLPQRAMVLAAGYGKRLRPLSTYFAKPALPLLGRPMIDYTFRRIARQGIREVVVNLHHRPETLEPALANASETLTVHRSFESEILGTAGGLKNAGPLLGKGLFLLLNGDTLSDFDLERMAEVHARSKARATLLLRPRPAGGGYSGIRVGNRGEVLGLERGRESKAELMFAGVWLLESSVIELLSGEPNGLEEELLPRLISEKSAFGSIQDGRWISIDTPRRYWEASLIMVRDRLFEEEWAVRRRPHAVVNGASARVLTGADTRVEEGVRFRGTVILGARCLVAPGAKLENVVCWDDATIPSGTSLANCVVTDGVALPSESELKDKVILKLGSDRSGLRRREIQDDLVVAELKSGRTATL